MTHGCVFETAFGWVGIALESGSLVRCITPRPTPEEAQNALRADEMMGEEVFGGLPERLRSYFAGQRVDFSGTALELKSALPFVRLALFECAKVPYGSTVSYGEIARRVGRPGACRAVGRAMASNPIPIIIPCHRVVRADGGLGGYSSGIGMKRILLVLEGVKLSC